VRGKFNSKYFKKLVDKNLMCAYDFLKAFFAAMLSGECYEGDGWFLAFS
jgi:hypothetical protein